MASHASDYVSCGLASGFVVHQVLRVGRFSNERLVHCSRSACLGRVSDVLDWNWQSYLPRFGICPSTDLGGGSTAF